MKLIWSVLVVSILGLQYRLWFGEGSFSEVWTLRQSVQEQAGQNHLLALRNQKLDAEVLDLKNGFQAIEERARAGLGMIGPNETFYLVVDTDR